jgi:hypothetical protein
MVSWKRVYWAYLQAVSAPLVYTVPPLTEVQQYVRTAMRWFYSRGDSLQRPSTLAPPPPIDLPAFLGKFYLPEAPKSSHQHRLFQWHHERKLGNTGDGRVHTVDEAISALTV